MPLIAQSEFIIFDVETTGLSHRWGDRIVEIAALKIKDLNVVDRFETLINPEREISEGAYRVNGISYEMVQSAPRAGEVLPNFLGFIGDACLVGHNVNFDLGFLDQELFLAGHARLDGRMVLDTVKMAKGLIPGLGSYSLSSLVYAFGIDEQQAHRAMSDVFLTYQVFKRLVETAGRKDIDDFEKLIQLFGRQLSGSKEF